MPDPTTAHTPSNGNHPLISGTTLVNLIILCILLFIFSGLLLTGFLTNIITMLAASLILTYILISPVDCIDAQLHKIHLKQRHLPPPLSRALAIVMVYLLFFGLLVITIIRIVPALSVQIKEFAHDIPSYVSRMHVEESSTGTHPGTATPSAELLTEMVQESSKEHMKSTTGSTTVTSSSQTEVAVTSTGSKPNKLFSATYAMALQKLVANYKDYLSKLGGIILDLGATTLNGLIYTLTTLVLVFYLLHDGKAIKDGIVDLMPARNEAAVDRFLNRLHAQFHGIIKGQILMSFIAGCLLYLILMAINIKYALLLGILFGIASILPVIGPWLGLIPIIGIIAFSSHPIDILQVLMVTGLFYITKTYWIWPKLHQRSYDIHPILFILTFVACMKLVGFLGILLSFPLASVLSLAFKSLQACHKAQEAQCKLPLN